jgi:hypothetical protein
LSGKGPRICRKRERWQHGLGPVGGGQVGGNEPEDRLRVSLTRARGLSGVDGCGRAGRDRGGQRGRGPFAGGAGGRRRPEVCPGRALTCIREIERDEPKVLIRSTIPLGCQGPMKPAGQDGDMQKAAFRVEKPPCKVFRVLPSVRVSPASREYGPNRSGRQSTDAGGRWRSRRP